MIAFPHGRFRLGLAVTLLSIAFGGLAQAAAPDAPQVLMQLDPPAQLPAGPQLAKRFLPIMTLSGRLSRTARLEGAVDPPVVNGVGQKLKRPLAAGQILMAAPNQPSTWCAPIRKGMMFAVAPCLTDADQDGRFESATTVTFVADSARDFAITEDQGVMGVTYEKVEPLAEPVSYSLADPGDGAPAKVRLSWQIVNPPIGRRVPKQPTLALRFEAGDKQSAVAVFSKTGLFLLTETGEGEVHFGGLTLRFLGFDERKNLRYEVVAAEPVAMPFGYLGLQTIYVAV